MLRAAFHAWRVIATCLAFLAFYVGGIVIGVPAVAASRLWPGTREAKELRAQRLIHRSFATFLLGLTALGLLTSSRAELRALRSRPGSLLIANHPTLLDVVFLIASLPHADCVVKTAVWDHPCFRGMVRGAGYIPNSEGPELVDACVERLARGRHVLLFPEGTRSPPGALRRFQRGAARIALRSRCDIQPILITCEPPTLTKGSPIFRSPPRRPHFSLTLLDPIRPADFLEQGEETPLAVRRLNARLESLYEELLGCRCG